LPHIGATVRVRTTQIGEVIVAAHAVRIADQAGAMSFCYERDITQGMVDDDRKRTGG